MSEELGKGGVGKAHHGTQGRCGDNCSARSEWHELPAGLKGARVNPSSAESMPGTPGGLAVVLVWRGDALLTVRHFWGLFAEGQTHPRSTFGFMQVVVE